MPTHRTFTALIAFCLFAVLPQAFASTFPPKANAAWVYDPQNGSGQHKSIKAGYFAHAMAQYNQHASADARIGELYVYGGDMEMYCPHHQAGQCRPKDFHVYYSRAAQHGKAPHSGKVTNVSVQAYERQLHRLAGLRGMILSPIIDGSLTGHGALRGFNQLSPELARVFADKVAKQVCADTAVDGIQFDLEPFDVSKKNGQYYFYKRIAHDFASRQTGCVDKRHPRGRFFSIFTAANRIRPHSASARHVRQIMRVANNGYIIDALYDLQGTPAGHQASIADYRRLVRRETRHMRRWAADLGLKFQFGVPAAAATHEYGACRGHRCRPAANQPGRDADDTQLAYVKAAMQAINASGARDDKDYLGVALWAWSPDVDYGGMRFSPAEPSPVVKRYLNEHL